MCGQLYRENGISHVREIVFVSALIMAVFSDAIRESNPTLAGTTHNKDTDFLTKVRENNFVSALILAVFQMQYAKATPRWLARRTVRTQTSLPGEPIGQVALYQGNANYTLS
jgi:hypothetical protein